MSRDTTSPLLPSSNSLSLQRFFPGSCSLHGLDWDLWLHVKQSYSRKLSLSISYQPCWGRIIDDSQQLYNYHSSLLRFTSSLSTSSSRHSPLRLRGCLHHYHQPPSLCPTEEQYLTSNWSPFTDTEVTRSRPDVDELYRKTNRSTTLRSYIFDGYLSNYDLHVSRRNSRSSAFRIGKHRRDSRACEDGGQCYQFSQSVHFSRVPVKQVQPVAS